MRALILDPVSGWVPFAWANPSVVPVAIAGNYAVASASDPGRAAVVDLATGAEQAAIPLPATRRESSVDLAADGRVVLTTDSGLVTARPGEAPRLLPGSEKLSAARFAGTAIAAIEDGRPVVLGADGSRHVFGPKSRVFTDLAADASGVTWLANGCVRYVALDAGVAAAPADDPCPSTEIGLYGIASSPLRGRQVRVPVRCVTAPTGTCRGTVLGKLGRNVVARGRFAVPVGAQRKIPMRGDRSRGQALPP